MPPTDGRRDDDRGDLQRRHRDRGPASTLERSHDVGGHESDQIALPVGEDLPRASDADPGERGPLVRGAEGDLVVHLEPAVRLAIDRVGPPLPLADQVRGAQRLTQRRQGHGVGDDRVQRHGRGVPAQEVRAIGLGRPPQRHLPAGPTVDLVVDGQVGAEQVGHSRQHDVPDTGEVLDRVEAPDELPAPAQPQHRGRFEQALRRHRPPKHQGSSPGVHHRMRPAVSVGTTALRDKGRGNPGHDQGCPRSTCGGDPPRSFPPGRTDQAVLQGERRTREPDRSR